MDRTTDGKGKVVELTLAEIKKLDAGTKFDAKFKGERVPTLREVLAGARPCHCLSSVYGPHRATNSANWRQQDRPPFLSKPNPTKGSESCAPVGLQHQERTFHDEHEQPASTG